MLARHRGGSKNLCASLQGLKRRGCCPGESQTLTLEIPAKDFAVYDDKAHAFMLEAGEYTVFVGGAIDEAEKIGSFALEKELTVGKTCSVLAPVEEVRGISADGTVRERTQMVPRSKVFPVQAAYQKSAAELSVYHGTRILFSDVKTHPEKLDEFVSQFSLKELVDFTVCNGSCFGSKQSGAAGKLAHSKKYGIQTYYMSDGNSSVNLNRRTTGFPSSNVLAGTFNKQLVYMVGEVLAKESKEYGIAINLGPAATCTAIFSAEGTLNISPKTRFWRARSWPSRRAGRKKTACARRTSTFLPKAASWSANLRTAS